MADEKVLLHVDNFSSEKIDLIKRTICRDATDSELELFIFTAKSLGLNPFARQIFAVKRWNSKDSRMEMSTQVSIDGFRLVAERTGKYAGQLGPFYSKGQVVKNDITGLHELVWYDGWPFDEAPKLAKIAVVRKDFNEPLWAQAKLSSYGQTDKSGNLTQMWRKMPEIMLAKCAESLALRKAFPNELSGVYTSDEMGQASEPEEGLTQVPSPSQPHQAKPQQQIAPRPSREVSQAAEEIKRVEPIKDYFDSTDEEHLNRLEGLLVKLDVPKDLYKNVSEILHGKTMTAGTVSAILKSLGENQRAEN